MDRIQISSLGPRLKFNTQAAVLCSCLGFFWTSAVNRQPTFILAGRVLDKVLPEEKQTFKQSPGGNQGVKDVGIWEENV